MNAILEWFSNFKRQRAIKKYARKLGPFLKGHYGNSRNYTPSQIRVAASKAELSPTYICYGYAMYLDKNDFDHLHQEMGEQCDLPPIISSSFHLMI